MGKNKNKAAYKVCRIGSETDSYLSLNDVTFSAAGFSFDIWLYMEGVASEILSQPGGFVFGIENGCYTVSHPKIPKTSVRSDILEITHREWINALVTYDNKVLSFFVNGVRINSLDIPDTALFSAGVIEIGRGFVGYIRTIRFYDTAVSENDFKRYMFQAVYTDEASMPNLSAFIDLTNPRMADLTPNGVKTRAYGGCAVFDVTQIYMPSQGQYASLNHGAHINPGGFENDAFSIYVKAYIRPSSQATQVLISNGDFDEQDSVIIYTKRAESSKFNVCVQVGEATTSLETTVAAHEWVDIIVSYAHGKLTSYVNGVAESYHIELIRRTNKGNLKIGNAFYRHANIYEDCTCQHYIAMAAVFQRDLAQKDADDFLTNHPFVFEDDLIALYVFNRGRAIEYVSCESIHLDSDDLFLAQRTTEELPDEPYSYRLNDTPQKASEMRIWEADVVLSELYCFFREAFGLQPWVRKEQAEAIKNRIANTKPLIDNNAPLYTEEVVTNEMIAQSVSTLTKQNWTEVIMQMALLNTPANAASGAATAQAAVSGSSLSTIKVALSAIALLAISFFITGVIVLSKTDAEKKREEKPDDPDDPDDDISLRILAISFQHAPDKYSESGVRCRSSEGRISVPEWSRDKKDAATAVYIASEIKKVALKARIEIKDTRKTPVGICNVRLSAFNASASNFSAFNHLVYTGNLSTNQTHEIMLTAHEIDMPKGKFSKCEMDLFWVYEIDGKKHPLPNTKCVIYVTPVIPAFPIQLDGTDEGRLIYYEFLDFAAAGTTEFVLKSAKATPEDLIWCTDVIYYHPRLRYQGSAYDFISSDTIHVQGRHITVITLRTGALMRELLRVQQEIEIECTAFAAILAYIFHLIGVHAEMVLIQSQHNDEPLQTNPIIPSKGVSGQHSFRYHYIVEVRAQPNFATAPPMYFDASCRSSNDQSLANYAFAHTQGNQVQVGDNGSYRGIVFQLNTYAMITTVNPPLNQNPIALSFQNI